MAPIGLVVGVMLAACSPARPIANEVDVDAAAQAAQADIDRYAAVRRQRLAPKPVD